MATKAEIAELNGGYRVEFTRIEHQFALIAQRFEAIDQRFEKIEETMHSDIRGIQDMLVKILERLDRIESSNARIIGFQTSGRTLRDDRDDY